MSTFHMSPKNFLSRDLNDCQMNQVDPEYREVLDTGDVLGYSVQLFEKLLVLLYFWPMTCTARYVS